MLKKWPILVVLLVLATAPGCGSGTTIDGAGATFPYPIYSKWAHGYQQQSGVQVNYQSIGSGGGISQVKNRTVAFGASDVPLEAKELNEANLVQFPLIIGGVVPVIHVDGIAPGRLRLSPELLADIFLGKVKNWNDPALQSINSDLSLPDKEITVVHRADGSGTTWIFTSYLAQISPVWKDKVGRDNAVEWPTGVGGKGNEGVANFVDQLEGAIGYVEYTYALQNKMNHVQLRNQAGKFVEPELETFQAAAANADWQHAPGFYMVLVNQPGEQSWPITGASFILLQKDQPNGPQATAMLKFFDYCYRQGSSAAKELDYVPIPEDVVTLVEANWKEQLRSAGKPIER